MKTEPLPKIKYQVGLNPNLVHNQKVSKTDLGIIFSAHGQKLSLFEEARSMIIKDNESQDGEVSPEVLKRRKEIVENITDLEFMAQEAWGFNQDANYHNWWLDTPGCSCPYFDNHDLAGVDRRIINQSCPWHGSIPTEETGDNDE